VRLLTDPILGRRVGPLRRLVPPPSHRAGERIDAVLLSHTHADHAHLWSLRRVGTGVPIVAAPGSARWLGRRGFGDVRELGPGERTTVGPVPVAATAADHDSRRWRHVGVSGAVGFLVGRDPCVYFAGDTDLFPEMESLRGQVDVALLPVAGWGPTVGPGHMDPDRAAAAAALIRPRLAIPIHWGTLGLPWLRPGDDERALPAHAFAAAVRRLAPGVETRVIEPGEAVDAV
jgi:L-ascorbate metabolism protein UlaG (beta-lactamase superfamily)